MASKYCLLKKRVGIPSLVLFCLIWSACHSGLVSTLGSHNADSSLAEGSHCFLWVICFYSDSVMSGWEEITSGRDAPEKTKVLETLTFLSCFFYSFKNFYLLTPHPTTTPTPRFPLLEAYFQCSYYVNESLYGRQCGSYLTLFYIFGDHFSTYFLALDKNTFMNF